MALVRFEKRIAFEVRREGLQIVNCDIYRGQGGRYGFLRLTNYGNVQARSAVFVIRTYDADKNPLSKFAIKLSGMELDKQASIDYDFPIPLDDDVAGFNFALTSLNGSSSFARPAGRAPYEVKDVRATIEMVDPDGDVIPMKTPDMDQDMPTPVAVKEEPRSPKEDSYASRNTSPLDDEDDGGDTFESEGEDDIGTSEDIKNAGGAALAGMIGGAVIAKPQFQFNKLLPVLIAIVSIGIAVAIGVIAPNIFYGLFQH